MKKLLIFAIALSSCSGCDNSSTTGSKDKKDSLICIIPPPPKQQVRQLNYILHKTFPHDTTSFTEGLLVHEGKLLESTGAPDYMPQTRSVFGIIDTLTGKINVKAELDKKKYFGEGLSLFNNKIYYLTWQNQVGFMYDAKTFNPVGQFSFKNKEGWGLTNDGTNFIMSDGTSDLSYFEPVNFNFLKTLPVNTIDHDLPDQLNELEYIDGFIYANVWKTNKIVKIDPANGYILGILDLTQLASASKKKYPNSQEMNGIAYDPVSKRMFVTGKMWPEMYVITIEDYKN
ncbi:MAG: hypothetical protein K0S32_776 [Bacteroidetes bacterium]|jgi:glutamine cyclotransferase|nr:hypothetical protein [Bacteroidota bacterium]